MDTPGPAAPTVDHAIRRYVQAHPHAVDTERGIREWWLRDTHPRGSPSDVHAAIERLVAAGELERRTLPDGELAYAVGPGFRPSGQP